MQSLSKTQSNTKTLKWEFRTLHGTLPRIIIFFWKIFCLALSCFIHNLCLAHYQRAFLLLATLLTTCIVITPVHMQGLPGSSCRRKCTQQRQLRTSSL